MSRRNLGTGRLLLAFALTGTFIALIVLFVDPTDKDNKQGRLPKEKRFQLVISQGNSERISAKGLTKEECSEQKERLVGVINATGLGGSVTCLAESILD